MSRRICRRPSRRRSQHPLPALYLRRYLPMHLPYDSRCPALQRRLMRLPLHSPVVFRLRRYRLCLRHTLLVSRSPRRRDTYRHSPYLTCVRPSSTSVLALHLSSLTITRISSASARTTSTIRSSDRRICASSLRRLSQYRSSHPNRPTRLRVWLPQPHEVAAAPCMRTCFLPAIALAQGLCSKVKYFSACSARAIE